MSCYQSNPKPAPWQAINRIMHYLRDAIDLVLCYKGRDLKLRENLDVDAVGNLDESRLTSGHAFMFGGGVISWCSKKQDCIALLNMEVGYVAYCLVT